MSEPKRYTLAEIAEAIVKTEARREASWRERRGFYALWHDEAAREVYPDQPEIAEIAGELAKHGEVCDWARGVLKRGGRP